MRTIALGYPPRGLPVVISGFNLRKPKPTWDNGSELEAKSAGLEFEAALRADEAGVGDPDDDEEAALSKDESEILSEDMRERPPSG